MSSDEGRFRIAGLQPGRYVVCFWMTVEGGDRYVTDSKTNASRYLAASGPGARAQMNVFAPGVFHKNKAKVFEIRGDEQVPDVDIEVMLSGLHSIRGHVLAKGGRHAPSEATVLLTDDSDKDFNRYAAFDADGSFHLDYLPAGTYTLTVQGPVDVLDANTTTRYADAKMPLIVGEHDAILNDILLVPAVAESADGNKETPGAGSSAGMSALVFAAKAVDETAIALGGFAHERRLGEEHGAA